MGVSGAGSLRPPDEPRGGGFKLFLMRCWMKNTIRKVFTLIIVSFGVIFILIAVMKMVNDWHDNPEIQSQAHTVLGFIKRVGIAFWNSAVQITQEFFHRIFQNS